MEATRSERFECDVCGVSLEGEEMWRNHQSTCGAVTGPYVCLVCFVTFGSELEIVQHITSEHSVESEELKTQLQEQQHQDIKQSKYQCDLCDETFLTKYHLLKHTLDHKDSEDQGDCETIVDDLKHLRDQLSSSQGSDTRGHCEGSFERNIETRGQSDQRSQMDKDAESETKENEESSSLLPDEGPQQTDAGSQVQAETLDLEEKVSLAECENSRDSKTKSNGEESEYLRHKSVSSDGQSDSEPETPNVTEPELEPEMLNVTEPEMLNVTEPELEHETRDIAAIENNIEVEIATESEEKDKRESPNAKRRVFNDPEPPPCESQPEPLGEYPEILTPEALLPCEPHREFPEDEPPEGASVAHAKTKILSQSETVSSDDEQEEGATCFVSHDDNDSNDNCDGEEETGNNRTTPEKL